jgi:hypothetical protein
MNSIFSRHTVSLLICFLVSAIAVNAQTPVHSRLLPDRVYTFTIKKSMGGSNSERELIPTASIQTMKIETGEEAVMEYPPPSQSVFPNRAARRP